MKDTLSPIARLCLTPKTESERQGTRLVNIWGRLDLAVPFTPFTPNRQYSNQVVLEHLYRRTPATPSSKVV